MSAYVRERIRRGAPSRRRKRAVTLKGYILFGLDRSSLSLGIKDGWIRPFQQGMRNADGSPRRAKFMLDISQMPSNMRVG